MSSDIRRGVDRKSRTTFDYHHNNNNNSSHHHAEQTSSSYLSSKVSGTSHKYKSDSKYGSANSSANASFGSPPPSTTVRIVKRKEDTNYKPSSSSSVRYGAESHKYIEDLTVSYNRRMNSRVVLSPKSSASAHRRKSASRSRSRSPRRAASYKQSAEATGYRRSSRSPANTTSTTTASTKRPSEVAHSPKAHRSRSPSASNVKSSSSKTKSKRKKTERSVSSHARSTSPENKAAIRSLAQQAKSTSSHKSSRSEIKKHEKETNHNNIGSKSSSRKEAANQPTSGEVRHRSSSKKSKSESSKKKSKSKSKQSHLNKHRSKSASQTSSNESNRSRNSSRSRTRSPYDYHHAHNYHYGNYPSDDGAYYNQRSKMASYGNRRMSPGSMMNANGGGSYAPPHYAKYNRYHAQYNRAYGGQDEQPMYNNNRNQFFAHPGAGSNGPSPYFNSKYMHPKHKHRMSDGFNASMPPSDAYADNYYQNGTANYPYRSTFRHTNNASAGKMNYPMPFNKYYHQQNRQPMDTEAADVSQDNKDTSGEQSKDDSLVLEAPQSPSAIDPELTEAVAEITAQIAAASAAGKELILSKEQQLLLQKHQLLVQQHHQIQQQQQKLKQLQQQQQQQLANPLYKKASNYRLLGRNIFEPNAKQQFFKKRAKVNTYYSRFIKQHPTTNLPLAFQKSIGLTEDKVNKENGLLLGEKVKATSDSESDDSSSSSSSSRSSSSSSSSASHSSTSAKNKHKKHKKEKKKSSKKRKVSKEAQLSGILGDQVGVELKTETNETENGEFAENQPLKTSPHSSRSSSSSSSSSSSRSSSSERSSRRSSSTSSSRSTSVDSESKAAKNKNKNKSSSKSKNYLLMSKNSETTSGYEEADSDGSMLDLREDLKPINAYIKDRDRMLTEMFRSIRGIRLQSMLPEVLKTKSFKEITKKCLETLDCMSKKRIKCILEDKIMESSSGTEESSDEENDDLNQSKKFKPIGFGAVNASMVHKGWHEARKADGVDAEVDESSEVKNEEQLDEKESQSNSFHSEMAAAGFKKMGKRSISIKIKTGDQPNTSLDGTTEGKKNTISPPLNQKQSLINKVKRKLDAKKPDEDKPANVDNPLEPERHISDGEKLQNQFNQYNKSLQQQNQQVNKQMPPVGHPGAHGHMGEMMPPHPPGVLPMGPFTRAPYYPYPQSVVPPPIDPRIMPPPMIRPNEMMFNHQMPPPHQIPGEVMGPRGPPMLPNQYSNSSLANMNYPLMPNAYPHISPGFPHPHHPHHHPDQQSNAYINNFLAQQHKNEEEEMRSFNVEDDTAYDLDDNEETSQDDQSAMDRSLANSRTRSKENVSKEIDYDYNYDFEMENLDEILTPQKEHKSKKSKKSKKHSKHSPEADNYYDKYEQKGYLSEEHRRSMEREDKGEDLDYIKQMLKSLLEMHITEIQNDPNYDFDIKLTLDNLLAQVVDDDGSLTYEDCENIHQIITELFDQEDDVQQQQQPHSRKSYADTDDSSSDSEERYLKEKKRKRDSSSKSSKISKSDMSRKSKKKRDEKRKSNKKSNDSNEMNVGDEHKKQKILTEVEAGEIDDDFEDDLHVEQEFNDLLHNV